MIVRFLHSFVDWVYDYWLFYAISLGICYWFASMQGKFPTRLEIIWNLVFMTSYLAFFEAPRRETA